MKRIIFLSSLLALLAGPAWLLSRRSSRVAVSEPLAKVQEQDAAKILIDNAGALIALEKKGTAWMITAPISDVADPQAMQEILSGLRSFSLSSQVSDDPDGYGDYDLTESSATRLRFFAGAGLAPVLDGYFGKEALGYGSHYFRRAGEKTVHLASGVSSYRLKSSADDWRERRLLGAVDQKALKSAVIRTALSRFELKKSGLTWTSPSRIKPENIEPLIADLLGLRAVDFIPTAEKSAAHVFDKPFLSFELDAGPAKTRLAIGDAKAETGKRQPRFRYARVSGRRALFLVSLDDVGNIIERLKGGK